MDLGYRDKQGKDYLKSRKDRGKQKGGFGVQTVSREGFRV